FSKMESRSMDAYRFGTVDYIVFLGMIILSTGTGIYFGYFKKSNKKAVATQQPVDPGQRGKHDFGSEKLNEYLMGSGNMKVFPVAMSLIASYISGIAILGTPAEIYNYGTQYWLISVVILFHGIVVSYVYLPVYTTLQVGSSYEYLELRFHSSIRSISSFIFVFGVTMYLPFVVYVPALALNQVSGINLYVIEVVIIVACVFYTIVGGLKAVVHTDVWQTVIMFVSVIVVAIAGAFYADMGPLFDELDQTGRLEFGNIDPSLYVRHTLWSVTIGGAFTWVSHSAMNPTMVHRYMSLPSLSKVNVAMTITNVGAGSFICICCFLGLLLFDQYKDCDPLTAGLISNSDQMLPLYVVQSVGHIYGMPGLFIAGIFGAGLSSLSVYFNSISMIILEDIVRGCFKMRPSERTSSILVKSVVVGMGLAAFALALLLKQLSGVLAICNSITSIASGTMFGIFTLGMLVPWANTAGTAVGGVAGFLLAGWVSFGSQIAAAAGHLNSQKYPISVEGCDGNVTLPETVWVNEEETFPLYRLSYHWVNPIGVVTVMVVGTLVSLLTKPTNLKTIDPDVISPVIHRYKIPRNSF
ncbi:hypothetical protein KR018_009676, partial [Drosophila ironensis]